MRPKFISVVYFEGRLLAFEEHGDCYEFEPNFHPPRWRVLSLAPWPEKTPNSTVSEIACGRCNGAKWLDYDVKCPRCGATGVEP